MTTDYRPCKLSLLRLWPYWQSPEAVPTFWEFRAVGGDLLFRPFPRRPTAWRPFLPGDGEGSLRPVNLETYSIDDFGGLAEVSLDPVPWETLEDLARAVREAREVPEASPGPDDLDARIAALVSRKDEVLALLRPARRVLARYCPTRGGNCPSPTTCSGPPTCEPLSRGDQT